MIWISASVDQLNLYSDQCCEWYASVIHSCIYRLRNTNKTNDLFQFRLGGCKLFGIIFLLLLLIRYKAVSGAAHSIQLYFINVSEFLLIKNQIALIHAQFKMTSGKEGKNTFDDDDHDNGDNTNHSMIEYISVYMCWW